MNQQTDKLFRDKLEGFSKPVPSHAWDRVEKNLDKKSGLVIWWKIAAAILLLAISTYILWPAEKSTSSMPLSSNQKRTEPEKSNPPTQIQLPPTTAETEPVVKRQKEEPSPKRVSMKSRPETIINKPEQTIIVADAQDQIVVEEITEQPIVKTESETAIARTTEPITKNITLVFRADDTDEYLNKKVLAKATEEEEKASTFKKLLKKAKGLKTNQDPYGELRQKKNEILALNFKSEKGKRGQNK